MDDQQFRQLLDFFDLSWEGYRKVRKKVKKRLARQMQELGFRGMDELLSALEKDLEFRKRVEILMTVSISRFFRDRGLWQALESHVLPAILAAKAQRIKIWSAGCARGEEAYSFKILWEVMRRSFGELPDLELWATDLNPEFLVKAREGLYRLSSLKEVSEEFRWRYFYRAKEPYLAISEFLKERILWKVHHLVADDPPQMDFQIIFLRNNLLTYYKDELQKSALRKILHSLVPRGFLIIGSHEKLPGNSLTLRPFPYHPNIFQKRQ